MKYFDILKKFCDNINLDFTIEMYEKFILYMKELIEYNKKVNLTSITDENLIIQRHFLDSLSIFAYDIKLHSTMCDVGSGAGFPGIPIKIIRNDIKIDLLESITKKSKFLEYILQKLDIKDINVINNRSEYVSRETYYREKYDYVISRAMARLNRLLEISFPLVKLNGKYIAFKGENYKEELEEGYNTIYKIGGNLEKIIHINEFNSNLIIINKVNETSNIYPRKYSLILKKPL